MNREELQNLIAPFYPALLLDAIISRRKRKIVRKILTVTLLIFIFVNLLTSIFGAVSPVFQDLPRIFYSLYNYNQAALGLLFITLAFWLISISSESFYGSYRFSGWKTLLPESGLSDVVPRVTLEAATVIYGMALSNDYTRAFAESRLGGFTLRRANVSALSLQKFFLNPARTRSVRDFSLMTETSVAVV